METLTLYRDRYIQHVIANDQIVHIASRIEMTVGAITQKEISSDENNELNNELMRPIESNWLEQWTPPILQKLQMEDETINGMVERYNQTAQIMLAMYVDENRSDWDDHLPYVIMAYRAAIHESTKCTPNKLMLGREISLPIDVIAGAPPDNTENECPIST
ncbi:unnamed protein product [Mytilus coruscus]|uniref:Integrase catalytic domain-containing protein n=1 Tax=Mytilus coruscus TaxID=42192 RepID=A0A6J8D989_MYTCO|nr:unnamed protein product [Mytilus coruscus]